MLHVDARKLTPSAQQALRRQAIRLRTQGMTYAEIAAVVGVHPTTVCQWYKAFERDGEAALGGGKRGRPAGTGGRLTPAQGTRIRRLITDKLPEQLKLSFALWTRQAVVELIEREYGLRLPVRTVGDYLRRWGMTPKKPVKRAYEQCPAAVRKWLDESYPAIAARARAEGAQIHWGDESGIRSDARYGRTYAPKGQRAPAPIPARRVRTQMISTVTNGGQMRFMLFDKAMNSALLIRFMRRLVQDTDHKVFLILDNLRVHHSRPVKKWLREHKQHIEVFYLPSYSPELNPDEYLNNDLKRRVHSNPPARCHTELKKQTLLALRSIQRRKGHVARYFQHPKVKYAA